jgi:hypothetical protein
MVLMVLMVFIVVLVNVVIFFVVLVNLVVLLQVVVLKVILMVLLMVFLVLAIVLAVKQTLELMKLLLKKNLPSILWLSVSHYFLSYSKIIYLLKSALLNKFKEKEGLFD